MLSIRACHSQRQQKQLSHAPDKLESDLREEFCDPNAEVVEHARFLLNLPATPSQGFLLYSNL